MPLTPEKQIQRFENAITTLTQAILTISGVSISVPPTGCFRVTNLYVNPDGKLEVKYDDTPVP